MYHRLTAVVVALVVLTTSASISPLSRSGSSAPSAASASSCSEWKTLFEAHWLKQPQCHSGATTASCCELYDLMAKSIRMFNHRLGCKFTNIDQYSAKFSAHCSSTGRVPASSDGVPPSTSKHGSGPINVIDGDASKPTTEHTSSGSCINCNPGPVGCSGSNCGTKSPPCTGSHCGGCTSGHCGGGCTSGNCGCVGSGCNRPNVAVCVGYNCGCSQCCTSPSCGCTNCTPQGGGGPNTGGTPNQGPIVLPNDDDDDVCFHGDGLVKLQDGGVKRMRELSVGDVVHVGKGKFSEVFMFTHQDADKRSTYVNMTVDSGEWVMVTPTHYMYSDKGLQLAGELKEGDIVEMDDGRMEMIVMRVVVRDKGLFNPQTIHGDVAVSGFRASTYTRTIQYETAHSLLAPLRAMYRICGAHISSAF